MAPNLDVALAKAIQNNGRVDWPWTVPARPGNSLRNDETKSLHSYPDEDIQDEADRRNIAYWKSRNAENGAAP